MRWRVGRGGERESAHTQERRSILKKDASQPLSCIFPFQIQLSHTAKNIPPPHLITFKPARGNMVTYVARLSGSPKIEYAELMSVNLRVASSAFSPGFKSGCLQ
jgi:hypothetical protein